jgi:hypothetical protein
MSRALSASLSLALLVAGCDSQELRSPECDQGQPVVASGRITLDDGVPEAEVSRMEVTLTAFGSSPAVTLARASLDAPVDDSVAFTLCADLASVDPVSDLFVTATARRAKVRLSPVSAGWLLERDALPSEKIELTLLAGGCQSCGPACDPACAFQ